MPVTVLGMLLVSRENACVCDRSVCTPLWCDLGRCQVAQTFARLQNHWLLSTVVKSETDFKELGVKNYLSLDHCSNWSIQGFELLLEWAPP